jgi:hypothetical protein
MILKLIGTELRSEIRLFSSFGLVALVLWGSMFGLATASETANPSIMTALVGLMAFVIGGIAVTMRSRRQRRTRLFAQLPVTPFEIRAANWIMAAIGLAVPLVLWLIFFGGNLPVKIDGSQLARVITLICSLVFIAIALISIHHTAGSMRRPLNLIVRLATILAVITVVLQFMQFINSSGTPGPFRFADQMVDWPVLLTIVIAATAVLVAADIWLDRLADNRLG